MVPSEYLPQAEIMTAHLTIEGMEEITIDI
jgi:hypothetical protein